VKGRRTYAERGLADAVLNGLAQRVRHLVQHLLQLVARGKVNELENEGWSQPLQRQADRLLIAASHVSERGAHSRRVARGERRGQPGVRCSCHSCYGQTGVAGYDARRVYRILMLSELDVHVVTT